MANIMNPITKRAYKVEFETSPITIEDLCKKYNITKEQLGNTDMWKKRETIISNNTNKKKRPEIFETVVRPDVSSKPAHITNGTIVLDDTKNMLDIIQETKELALKSTKEFFENYDTNDVTTKEFKDMVGVLKDLEAGELLKEGKGKGPTINILVQNLVERFKDDC